MKLSIDHNSAIPLYLQAEQLLREMIILPKYQEGKLLPNEVDIANKLGISRNTLRQATNKLVYEGLIYRKKGVGTIVSKPVDSKANNWLSFTQEMKSKGIEVVNYDIAHAWVVPDDKILNFFGLKNGTKVLKMDRLRGGKDGPFVYFTSYFHPRIGLTGEEDFNRKLYDILQQDYSVIAKLSKEEITAQACSLKLSKRLKISPGEPILVRQRKVYDPGKRPIEYNIGSYRANSVVYTVESERDVF
ncbi:MAG: GntR family transcriptional regulator [Bacteroidetes bacterium]|nr:MAG: GntR family transcriptional regulator [Bacteroidota bacterium]